MKKALLYLLALAALFVLLYSLEASREPEFSWHATYSRYDKQPFGTYVFDRLVGASFPQPYRTTYQTLYQLLYDDTLRHHNLLLVGHYYYSEAEELTDLLNYVSAGNTVLIAADEYGYTLLDTLLLQQEYNHSSWVSELSLQQDSTTTIHFVADSAAPAAYTIPRALCYTAFRTKKKLEAADSVTLRQPHLPATVLVEDENGGAVLLKYTFGKGRLLLSTTPKLFTNYGILDTLNSGFVWHTLGYLQDQPLLRLDSSAEDPVEQSPLRYILRHRSLRWGLYVLLATLLLFFIFTAKRRQRPVPIIKKPVNNLRQFAYSIAALYLQKNDNADLIRKKYIYWADRLKRTHGIDIINEAHTPDFIARFAAKTNRQADECAALFRQLDAVTDNSHVPDEVMKDLITKINNIH